jgi:hypothetical protein
VRREGDKSAGSLNLYTRRRTKSKHPCMRDMTKRNPNLSAMRRMAEPMSKTSRRDSIPLLLVSSGEPTLPAGPAYPGIGRETYRLPASR